MKTGFCLEALHEAFERYGKPKIFNTDPDSQFTSEAFTGALKEKDIRISMDGKGCWRDNVFAERLWRSIKYKEVYLRSYDSVRDAKAEIDRYIDIYNQRRPYSQLRKQSSAEFYFNALPTFTEVGIPENFILKTILAHALSFIALFEHYPNDGKYYSRDYRVQTQNPYRARRQHK